MFLGAGSNKQNQLKGISEQMVAFKIDKLNEVVVCWNASIFYKKYSKQLAIWGDSKFGLTSKTDVIEAPEEVQWIGAQSESIIAVLVD